MIHLTAPPGQQLAVARVYVNGRRGRVLSGRRLRIGATLRGLLVARVSVKVVARTTTGRTLTAARRYRACRG